jgi:hypothetical protein
MVPLTRNSILGRRGTLAALGALGLLTQIAACSNKSGDDSSAGAGGQNGGTPVAPDGGLGFNPNPTTGGAPGQGQGGSGGVPGTTGAYPCLENPQGACAGKLYKGQSLPTDLFVMFDQSGSMLKKDDGVTTRMDAVRNAVDQFMQAPESGGLGIGIGYFGYHPLQCACTSCNPSDYATPKVTIGDLPAQAGAIMGSLKEIKPEGETPTGAAIRGACMYAKTRKAAEPMRNIAILLVTDGEPEAPLTSMKGTCNPTIEDASAAAGECAAAGIPTYVLGVGPALNNLNQIAAAGQTRSAYLVANGGTPGIVKALGEIRSNATIPCQMMIPRVGLAEAIDFMKVNVVYSDAACKVSTFGYVEAADKCNGQTGGWYYDNAMMPTQINLCGPTCEQVKAAGGQLVVSVGCMTRVIQ